MNPQPDPKPGSIPDSTAKPEAKPIPEPKSDPSAVKIIAAARECLIRNGMRTTITDVARLAGLSRPTVYRKFQTLEEIISETLTREMVGLIGDVTNPASVEEFIETIVNTTERVRRNELMQSILSEEPELLVTYQFHRLGRSQLAIMDVLERMLRALPGAHPENLKPQVLFILMLVQSVAFMANTVSDYFDDASWKQELRKMLKGYLQ